CMQHLEYPYTF
nr:immunoglobulin light chain junction region [Mus musculus]NSM01037.1 immunoglobulin light chain junction region [Mus musculus]